jgi:hypothetical protein
MVDPARAGQLLEALEEYRSQLERLRGLPAAEYQGDSAFAGRYLVQASAQSAPARPASSCRAPTRAFWNKKVFALLEKVGWHYLIGVRRTKTVRAAV